jgi:hypothetical protein
MNVKKRYAVGDTVWIYGVNTIDAKSTEGKVVKAFNIEGYNDMHYVISIPTEIEPLLEIRTWQTISQTKDGHVGSLREAFENPDAAHRMMSRTGIAFISVDDNPYTGDGHDGMGSTLDDFYKDEEDDISPDAIHAAMERSQQSATLPPLNLKDGRPKRRHYPRKKKV